MPCTCALYLYPSELGIAHSFQSFNTCYKDTGLWGIYFVTDALHQDDMVFNIQNEWMRLATSVTDFEVNRCVAGSSTLICRKLLQTLYKLGGSFHCNTEIVESQS